jgi:hypothetical protein
MQAKNKLVQKQVLLEKFSNPRPVQACDLLKLTAIANMKVGWLAV